MTMQRRHFELIAEIIDSYDPGGSMSIEELTATTESVAKHFAHKLRSTNPNFNEARFLRACGVEA